MKEAEGEIWKGEEAGAGSRKRLGGKKILDPLPHRNCSGMTVN